MSKTGDANSTETFESIDLNRLVISKPVASALSKGSQNMYIGSCDRTPFKFQLSSPKTMVTPSVLFVPEAQPATPTRISMGISISNKNTDMLDFWKKLDGMMINHMVLHSKEFLKTPHTYEEVASKFTSALRTKEGFDPYLKVRFDTAKDARTPFSCCCANITSKKFAPIDWRELRLGDSLICIVNLGMIYCVNGRIGYTVDMSSAMKYARAPPKAFPFVLNNHADDEEQVPAFKQCSYDDLWQQETTSEIVSSDHDAPVDDFDDSDHPSIEYMEHCVKKQKTGKDEVQSASNT